ncbi:MAG: DUF2846 domain-containing protein [Pyrinomonadaceae bacterium]
MKNLLLLTSSFLLTAVVAAAQDQNKVFYRPDIEGEQIALRTKACGTEKVDYDAETKKDQHPTPDAPADKALVYVMRTTIIGYKIHSKLAVDGKWVGTNRGKTYFFITLDPGEHFICSESENQDAARLTVEAGKTYYLQQQVKAGMWKARTKLALLDEAKGKEELKDLNLSVFTVKTK